MNIERLYQLFLQHPSIQTDTRRLKEGDLFFALKGPNFNGNQFALGALGQGAAYAIIDEEPTGSARAATVSGSDPAILDPAIAQAAAGEPDMRLSERLILVDDVLETLQALALHHRRQFDIPFIAITGSNGKTTTKELVHAVLASKYSTYTTVGNLNNHIGVPLTLLSIKKDAQFAVIEMGANHQKEIESYCRYTLPTHGIITNAGKAHLEGFGGAEGVKKGKGELYAFLREHGGAAFVMWDYDYLREMSRGIPHILRYGTRDAEITGIAEVDGQPSDPAPFPGNDAPEPMDQPTLSGSGSAEHTAQPGSFLRVRITGGAAIGIITTQLVGDYNLPNVLAAVAVGKHFGVPDDLIRRSIEAYAPSNSRSQLIHQDSNHIILDAYNANPSSMRAAIENFARLNTAGAEVTGNPQHGGPESAIAAIPGSPKTAASGPADQSPLSGLAGQVGQPGFTPADSRAFSHKVLVLGAMAELGEESLDEHRQIVELIGKYPWRQVVLVGGDFLRIDHPYLSFKNSREAGDWLRQDGFTDTWLLIKGSRSMKMEEVLL